MYYVYVLHICKYSHIRYIYTYYSIYTHVIQMCYVYVLRICEYLCIMCMYYVYVSIYTYVTYVYIHQA